MKTSSLVLSAILCATVFPAARSAPGQLEAEARVLEYLRGHVRPGQPLIVTELYNNVFTKPEERKALNKLYGAFFRIPLFLAQYQERFGAPPKLKVIAEQFDLASPEAAATLLRVMDADPRVPRFLTQDPETHEITSVDVATILNHPRFGQALVRQLSGWEGKPAPPFKLQSLAGDATELSALRGRLVLLNIWFTGCPPCVKQTPELVALSQEFPSREFTIVGANADRVLGLSYDDAVRLKYVEEHKITFPVVHWTSESDTAYGNISIFPTQFLIDGEGTVIHHWVGYVEPDELRRAVAEELARPRAGQ
ncbi:MAG: TlpA family protein disulfide reductase [Acidobacteria bacterium]|nr:TlpA family protein disulfide reductase [Acidobacteriota bacterium]